MSDDIVKRLREWNSQYEGKMPNDMVIASDLIEYLRQQLADMTVDRDELLASQWIAVRGAAELAIEKCKNSTGQRRVIDLYVSPNQCAEDILDAIKAAKEQGK